MVFDGQKYSFPMGMLLHGWGLSYKDSTPTVLFYLAV